MLQRGQSSFPLFWKQRSEGTPRPPQVHRTSEQCSEVGKGGHRAQGLRSACAPPFSEGGWPKRKRSAQGTRANCDFDFDEASYKESPVTSIPETEGFLLVYLFA